MFEKLSDNLNLLMAKTRINASELARRTGVPASTIKKIRNNNNPNPTLTTLIPLARNFMISVSHLVGDITPSTVDAIQVAQSVTKTDQLLPLLTWEQMIAWPNSSHDSDMHAISSIQNEYGQHAYVVSVPEEDWDGFTKGSMLIIDPAIAPNHHDYVIVHKEGQAIPVLRQMICDEGDIYLKPAIKGCHVNPISSQHHILGVVVESRRIFKTNKIES